MSADIARLRAMQILCFGFIMGITMIIVIFGVAIWSPEPKGEAGVFLIAAMVVMLMSYAAGMLMNKIKLRQLIEKSMAAGKLDLDVYQQLMIFRMAILEAPALVSIIFFVFLVGGSPFTGLNLLFLIPVLVFYIGIFKVFPTQARIDRIQELISWGT